MKKIIFIFIFTFSIISSMKKETQVDKLKKISEDMLGILKKDDEENDKSKKFKYSLEFECLKQKLIGEYGKSSEFEKRKFIRLFSFSTDGLIFMEQFMDHISEEYAKTKTDMESVFNKVK
ncbi:hypothetical protein M1446_01355 [Candidatus Dependentiae bacterium]|nr:hypothetical protein [Candidatus Dependentiae bacterium]